MLNDEQKRMKAKLLKQVEQYERKGYKDTAAHEVLANLLKLEKETEDSVSVRTPKAKSEATNGK